MKARYLYLFGIFRQKIAFILQYKRFRSYKVGSLCTTLRIYYQFSNPLCNIRSCLGRGMTQISKKRYTTVLCTYTKSNHGCPGVRKKVAQSRFIVCTQCITFQRAFFESTTTTTDPLLYSWLIVSDNIRLVIQFSEGTTRYVPKDQ